MQASEDHITGASRRLQVAIDNFHVATDAIEAAYNAAEEAANAARAEATHSADASAD
ncbi:MAG TPA: hypothetical protein VGL63_12110 [Streptosporangiaceae bacterium]